MSEFFSYSGIKDFLKRAGEMYGVYSFRSWKGGNGIILRHDIDFDLNAANRMADLEKELGITATYFIMTSSERYNACSRSNRDLIRRLARNGFEIGLHFDPQIYDGSPSMAEEVEREARLLESISGSKVESISLHNPSVRMEFPLFDGYRNAYDPSIFSSDNYLSDSCMDFRGKYPEVFISKAGSGPLQLLLHPMHYTEDHDEYPEIILDFLVDVANGIERDFLVNWKFREQMKGRHLVDLFIEEPGRRL